MPPPGGATAEVFLSVAQGLIATAPGETVANVVFQGLGLYYARGVGLSLSAAVNASVLGCTSALHGHSGLEMQGSALLLRDSTVYGTGCQATSMGGGDLATLTRSGNAVINNTVHSFARITRTYEPGIRFSDVGGLYANNTIANGPHTGVTGGGALNLFEGNLFDSLLFEASDAGAFYVGFSWTNRGNILRGNTFRNIRATEKTFLGYPRCADAVAAALFSGARSPHPLSCTATTSSLLFLYTPPPLPRFPVSRCVGGQPSPVAAPQPTLTHAPLFASFLRPSGDLPGRRAERLHH